MGLARKLAALALIAWLIDAARIYRDCAPVAREFATHRD